MGRNKIEIKKILEPIPRRSAFSKRRGGLIKKGYEISVLADTPTAIIAFSPDNQLCLFSRGGRVEDILINYLNGPDDPRIVIPNRNELIALLQRIKRENDRMATEQESRNGEGSSRINPADQDEDLERLLSTGNRDLLDVVKEIVRVLNRHPQTASIGALQYCQVKLHLILNEVALRKNQQDNPHQQQQQQQYYPPQQLQQQQQYYPPQQQQYYPLQQRLQQQYQQQQQQHTQLVTVAHNMNSPNYMSHFLSPTYGQQRSGTIHQNNMNMASSGTQNRTMTFTEHLLEGSSNIPVQQPVPSFYQNNSERRILRGGSSSNGSFCQNENIPLPIQYQYHSDQMRFPNGSVVQDMNQNPIQPHAANGHDRSSISFQQPTHDQNLFGGIYGAADNLSNDLDQPNKKQ